MEGKINPNNASLHALSLTNLTECVGCNRRAELSMRAMQLDRSDLVAPLYCQPHAIFIQLVCRSCKTKLCLIVRKERVGNADASTGMGFLLTSSQVVIWVAS